MKHPCPRSKRAIALAVVTLLTLAACGTSTGESPTPNAGQSPTSPGNAAENGGEGGASSSGNTQDESQANNGESQGAPTNSPDNAGTESPSTPGEDPNQSASETTDGGGNEESSPATANQASLQAEIDEIIAITERLRELEFIEQPQIALLDAESFRQRFQNLLIEELEELSPAEDALYKLLGLIEEEDSFEELLRRLYSTTIIGFYDSDTKEVVVPITEEFGALQESTLVHELVHALADQHFDFTATSDQLLEEGRFDELASLRAVVEGDASFVQEQYVVNEMSIDELFELATIEVPADFIGAGVEVPSFLEQSLYFPYLDGLGYVKSLYDRQGVDAVNLAYSQPPKSTEQVYFPYDSKGQDEPLAVERLDLEIPGYELEESGTWGLLAFTTMFDQVLNPEEGSVFHSNGPSRPAAEGWGGDHYSLWYDGSEIVLALTYRGDTETDAVEFEAAMREYIQAAVSPGPSQPAGAGTSWNNSAYAWLEISGDTVRFIAASDPEAGDWLRLQLAGEDAEPSASPSLSASALPEDDLSVSAQPAESAEQPTTGAASVATALPAESRTPAAGADTTSTPNIETAPAPEQPSTPQPSAQPPATPEAETPPIATSLPDPIFSETLHNTPPSASGVPQVTPDAEPTNPPLKDTENTPESTEDTPEEILPTLNHRFQDELNELITITQQIRGLEFLEPPTVLLLDSKTYDARNEVVSSTYFTGYEEEDALMTLLGLVDPEDELGKLHSDLFSGSAVGYYDFNLKKVFVRIDENEINYRQRSTILHELVHVLTDQHFDFAGTLLKFRAAGETDKIIAFRALFEGDARLAQSIYYWGVLDDAEREAYRRAVRQVTQVGRDISHIPSYIRDRFNFQYTYGNAFVRSIFDDGLFTLINEAYTDPPTSTEQIFFHDKYPEEPPLPVEHFVAEIPDYQLQYTATWGALGFVTMFDQILSDLGEQTGPERAAAQGWGGDRYSFWYDYDGEEVAFALTFQGDTEEDAEELAETLHRYTSTAMDVAYLLVSAYTKTWVGRDFAWIRQSGTEVKFVAASDPEVGEYLAEQYGSR